MNNETEWLDQLNDVRERFAALADTYRRTNHLVCAVNEKIQQCDRWQCSQEPHFDTVPLLYEINGAERGELLEKPFVSLQQSSRTAACAGFHDNLLLIAAPKISLTYKNLFVLHEHFAQETHRLSLHATCLFAGANEITSADENPFLSSFYKIIHADGQCRAAIGANINGQYVLMEYRYADGVIVAVKRCTFEYLQGRFAEQDTENFTVCRKQDGTAFIQEWQKAA